MLWVVYALLTAFLSATNTAFSKHILKNSDEFVVSFFQYFFASLFLLPILFFADITPIPNSFWITIVFLLPFDITALILYYRAIKLSDLSLTVPLLSFTPFFTIFISYALLNETITLTGFIGVLFITIGAYVLNLKEIKNGLLHPYKKLLKNRGSLIMLFVALIFGLTSALGKKAIIQTSPITFLVVYNPILGGALFLILLFKFKESKIYFPKSPRQIGQYILMGVFFSSSIFFHCFAISMAPVAYMISLKRLNLLFVLIYSWLIFKERDIGIRFIGGLIMFMGAILIVFA